MKNKVIRKKGQGIQVLKRLSKNRTAMAGLFLLLAMIITAVISPRIIPYRYDALDFTRAFALPSREHWFGCDELGRDILSRIMYGARYSLTIGLLAVLAGMLIGTVIGAAAGYFGGSIDNILMRFLDILSAIPGTLMAIVISAVFGPGFGKCILAIAISTMPQYARVLRGSIMSVRDMEYLEAASSINCSSLRIIAKHIFPNAFSALLVTATMNVGTSILMAAGLSYIGLGVQPPAPEWGAMLSGARAYIRDYPHMVLFPGIAIMVTVLCLNMFGDGLRDALDPKLKR